MDAISSFETLFIITTLVLYSVFVWILREDTKDPRKGKISSLLLYNLTLLCSSSILFSLFLEFGVIEHSNIFLEFGFLLILSFVVTVEIPGYLHLSSYDSESLRMLKKTRKSLISVSFNLESSLKILQGVLKNGARRLESIGIFDSLQYLADSIERTRNIDRTLLDSTLNEVNWMIREISQQSKHPFPKLIDIFSLAGLSFLIAQLLKLIG